MLVLYGKSSSVVFDDTTTSFPHFVVRLLFNLHVWLPILGCMHVFPFSADGLVGQDDEC